MGNERVVYGVHSVTELLRQRRDISALLMQTGAAAAGSALCSLWEEARRIGFAPIERPRSELDRMVGGGTHQGVVALCGEYRYATLDDLFARAGDRPPLLLVLDGVLDPQNLGALLRSAHVLSAHGVIIPQDRAAPVTPAVVKASSGAAELVPVARVPNLVRALQAMKERGVWLYAAALLPESRPPWEVDLAGAAGLVLGGEGKGLRPLVRKTCDVTIEVPMAADLHGSSLNVAAAGAVLLYEALRQRQAPGQRCAAPSAPAPSAPAP